MTAGRVVRELWCTNQELSPVDIIPTWFMLICHLEDEQRPISGRSSETYSQPTDIVITIILDKYPVRVWIEFMRLRKGVKQLGLFLTLCFRHEDGDAKMQLQWRC
jgi:hypothetical protein